MSFPALTPPGGSGGPRDLPGWDRLVIGGEVMPGKWRITGGHVKLKKDPKDKAGVHGANPVFHGIDPQEFTAEGYFWTDEQMSAFLDICRRVLPRPGLDPKPVPVAHPDLLHLGTVVNMVVLGASPLSRDGNARTVRFFLQHWLSGTAKKNQNATKQPTQSVRNLRSERARELREQNTPPSQQDDIASFPQMSGG